MNNLLQLFQSAETEMNQYHFERKEIIRSLIVALLAQVHAVLLGPPGTGKSRIVRDICRRVMGQYFEWLLTRMTTPEELFGPMSLKALEHDQYRRITTGKLPEAEIAYLDEIFKGSSAILNTMLGVLNERVFHNNGQPTQLPLQMVVGSSNELPEDREELGALWDRFLIRHVVYPIKDQSMFMKMLTVDKSPVPSVNIQAQDLEQAQQEVTQVDLSEIYPVIASLRSQVNKLGIAVSDRRWHDAMNVVQANAWMNGHGRADSGDLDILQHVLWDNPEQRTDVAKAILTLVSPFDQEAQDILDEGMEAYQVAMAAPEDEQTQAGLEASKQLKSLIGRLEKVRDQAAQAGNPCRRAEEGVATLKSQNQEVFRECLKVEV